MSPLSQKLIFPRLTRSEAQALASLATPGHGLSLTGLPAGQSGNLHIMPLPPGEAPLHAADSQRLHIEWAGGQLALDLAPWVIDKWMGLVLGIHDLSSVPENFRTAALSHVVQWLTEQLSLAGRGTAQLVQVDAVKSPRPTDMPHAVSLQLDIENTNPLPVVLHLDSLALMLVGSLAQMAPKSADPQSWDDLPVALELCIGETSLSLDQFKRIRTGGCIFLNESFLQSGQGLLLRTPIGHRQTWCVPATLDGLTLTLLAQPSTMNTQTAANTDQDDASPNWDNMPVHLTFDVGRKTLTLAELRQLTEGQALPLDRPVQAGVTIRANGAVIGEGQLVDIDGQMGVLVSQLRAPSAAASE